MKSVIGNKIFSGSKTLNIQGRLIDLDKPKVMGILNVTPDSFYDGGRFTSGAAVVSQVEKMLKDGAAFIDVGGYSSRPGAADIPVEEERKRVVEAVSLIVKNFPEAMIVVDTFRSAVAKAAVEEGAAMVNDISGGALDPVMFDMVSKLQVPYILMHMRGTPQNMTQHTGYENMIREITDYFHEKIFRLHQLGVKDIIADPGFGFAKTPRQNFELLQGLDYFGILGKPILVGLSRKSMIWRTLNSTPEDALNGTTALNTVAVLKGANILRVHDVKEAVEVVNLVSQLRVPADKKA